MTDLHTDAQKGGSALSTTCEADRGCCRGIMQLVDSEFQVESEHQCPEGQFRNTGLDRKVGYNSDVTSHQRSVFVNILISVHGVTFTLLTGKPNAS